MPNERSRIHEHKSPFRKHLSAQAFKVYSFVSPYERCVQKQHMVTVQGALFSSSQLTAFAVLLLTLAIIKQRCNTAGAPFWIGGELPVFVVRPHAPNREVHTMTFGTNTCTVPSLEKTYFLSPYTVRACVHLDGSRFVYSSHTKLYRV